MAISSRGATSTSVFENAVERDDVWIVRVAHAGSLGGVVIVQRIYGSDAEAVVVVEDFILKLRWRIFVRDVGADLLLDQTLEIRVAVRVHATSGCRTRFRGACALRACARHGLR